MVANFVPLVAVMARGAISVAVATQPAKNLNWSVNPEVPHVPNNETFAHDSGPSNAVQLCAARRVDDAPVSPVTSTPGQNRAARSEQRRVGKERRRKRAANHRKKIET